ncbi:hypothetical protein [Tissierella pigra]|nr:hypothetical protein [Tissierella pigra]
MSGLEAKIVANVPFGTILASYISLILQIIIIVILIKVLKK